MQSSAGNPSQRVERSLRAVAATVTGARISTANGLFSPPVSISMLTSCARSKNRQASVPRSLSRISAGCTICATRLNDTEAEMTSAQSASGSSKPNQCVAISTAPICPAMAIQRTTTSVRRRTQSPRSRMSKNERCWVSAMTALFRAPARPQGASCGSAPCNPMIQAFRLGQTRREHR